MPRIIQSKTSHGSKLAPPCSKLMLPLEHLMTTPQGDFCGWEDWHKPLHYTILVSLTKISLSQYQSSPGVVSGQLSEQCYLAYLSTPHWGAPSPVPGVSYWWVTGSSLWVYVLQMSPVSRPWSVVQRTQPQQLPIMCWAPSLWLPRFWILDEQYALERTATHTLLDDHFGDN